MRLPRSFFARDTRIVARELLGKRLVVRGVAATIVETEAYHGLEDQASHAHRGLTARNAPMFGEAGHAYVYLVYGMHHCFNIVTMHEGFPAAVLVRAVELPDGAGRGPGKLCKALGIDRSMSGLDLCSSDVIWLEDGAGPRRARRTPRVGVDYAGRCAQRPWRFVWPEHPAVSRS